MLIFMENLELDMSLQSHLENTPMFVCSTHSISLKS
jgi:hypothetical protein